MNMLKSEVLNHQNLRVEWKSSAYEHGNESRLIAIHYDADVAEIAAKSLRVKLYHVP